MDIEAILVEKQAQARARVEGLRRDVERIIASADSANDDEHDPEGTTAFERAQAQSLLAGAEQQWAEIAAARERVRAGTYGSCESCDGPIAVARLEARPIARTCLQCAAGARR